MADSRFVCDVYLYVVCGRLCLHGYGQSDPSFRIRLAQCVCPQYRVLTPESHKFLSDKLHTKNATGDFYTFMDRLEHHPAVESVCYTRMHKHYVWTNQGASLIYDTITCNSWMRTVSSGYFRVFRVKGADGSSPEQLAGRANLTDIIITDNLAGQLFPGRSAVGEWVKNTLNGERVRIAAVCRKSKV